MITVGVTKTILMITGPGDPDATTTMMITMTTDMYALNAPTEVAAVGVIDLAPAEEAAAAQATDPSRTWETRPTMKRQQGK
jgi:hypothetical protein